MLIKEFTKSMIDNRGDPGTLIHTQHLCDMRIDRGFSFSTLENRVGREKKGREMSCGGMKKEVNIKGPRPAVIGFSSPFPFREAPGYFVDKVRN